MAKKRRAKRRTSAERIELTDYGIDLPGIIQEIRPHLEGTTAEIAAEARISKSNASNMLNGITKPSLGAVAALAKASGARLVVEYEPPKNR